MNNIEKNQTIVISVRDIIWDLLAQWRALLLIALLMMLLVVGLKYTKDIKVYNTAQQEKENEAVANIPADQKIADILDTLPDDERATVEFMVKQDEWIETEKEYLNKSILMNANPENQRTLLIDYFISDEDGSDATTTALYNAYIDHLWSEDIIEGIKSAMGVDVENRYISELISSYNGTSNINGADQNAMFEVRVALPDGADAGAVEKSITDVMTGYSSELNSRIAPHTIKLIGSSETYFCNIGAINNRNNILYSVNNLTNNAKNLKTNLSDAETAAIEGIKAIKKEATNIDTSKEADDDGVEAQVPPKPGFSKKYALLGFILGAMMYAFLYTLYIILKGKITSSGQTEYYTGSRLLGEVYHVGEHKGIRQLLHSKLVDNIRYKGRLDEDKQIAKASSSIESVCRHAGTDTITLFKLSGISNGADVLAKISDTIREKGFSVDVKDVNEDSIEEDLLTAGNAVCISGSDSKANDLLALAGLMRDYDVNQLGNIYIGAV